MFDALIDQVMQALGVVLAGALVALVIQILRKIGITLDADKQAQLEYFAKQAVLRVEEYAATYAKKKLVGLTESQKFSMAVTDLIEKVPRVDRVEAERIVTAVLPQLGIGAAAGVTHLGNALRTPEAR